MNGSENPKEARRRYVASFNDTMIKIWREKISLMKVVDTGQLYKSVASLRASADNDFVTVQLSQSFLEYGLWQDYGTGKEVPRGNPGDIGRDKARQPRRWFSKKYFASVMNLQEFYADNLGMEGALLISDALSKKQGAGRNAVF